VVVEAEAAGCRKKGNKLTVQKTPARLRKALSQPPREGSNGGLTLVVGNPHRG
jgi:hypothetical protein